MPAPQTSRTVVVAALALGLGVVLGCSVPAPPAVPPADLAPPPAAEPPVVVEEPFLPPVPTVTAGPRGPLEMTLPTATELTAAEAGALVPGTPPRLVLTLEPCRIAEAEPAFGPDVDEDHCRTVNQATFEDRTQRALVVSPGAYEIEVLNRSFDRDLGFWLRRRDDPSVTAVSAGGIPHDGSRTWAVSLSPGEWVYSCPLSPTPDYRLVVR